jgi:hypothetical protein
MSALTVTRGIARGELRLVDPELVAQSMVLHIVMACTHRHAISPFAPRDSLMNHPELFDEHVELVLEGLTSHTTQPSI